MGGLFVHTPLDFHGQACHHTCPCWLASPPWHVTTPPHPVAHHHDHSVLPACTKACLCPWLDSWTTRCQLGNTQATHNCQHITQPWFPTWCVPATATCTPHVKDMSPPPDMVPTGLGCIHTPPKTQETWGSPTPHALIPTVKCDHSYPTLPPASSGYVLVHPTNSGYIPMPPTDSKHVHAPPKPRRCGGACLNAAATQALSHSPKF